MLAYVQQASSPICLNSASPVKEMIKSSNVETLVETALQLAANDYDLKKKYDFLHLKITKEFAPDLPEIKCSRTEIEQVLFNLFKNAAQAMSINTDYSGKEPCICIRTTTSTKRDQH